MSLVPLPTSQIVLTMSMPGRRVLAPPMSDHRTRPSASAAARSTFARSGAWARADGTVSAPASASSNATAILAFMGLVMFLRDDVRQVALAARLRFREHRVEAEQRDARRRGPRFEQIVGVLDGGGPRQRVAVAGEPLDDVHVLAVHVAADLIKPRVAVEAPRIDDQRVAVPVRDA